MTKHQNRGHCVLETAVAGAVTLLLGSAAGAAGFWSTAQMVGPDDNANSIFPNVEVSPGGIVWIVWSSTDPVGGDDETYCVTIQDSVQSERQKIHEDNAIMDRCPLMSMGSDGLPWVVWERYSPSEGYIQVVSHWDGAGWVPADTVLVHGERWDEYTIYASSSEDVWIARSSSATGRADCDIYVRHWDGTAWGEVEQLGFDGRDDTQPVVTTDSSGAAWVAWLRLESTTPDSAKVFVSRRDVGGWSTPVRVDTLVHNLAMCDCGTLPDGRLAVLWTWSPLTAPDVECAALGESGWEFLGPVNKPDGLRRNRDASARLSHGAAGPQWAVWESSVNGVWQSAITASYWVGDGWSDEELVSAPDTLSLSVDETPDVAVGPDGRVWAVWQRMDDASPYDTDIYVAWRAALTPVDVWGLSADWIDGAIQVSWQASQNAAQAGFGVWRATGVTCLGMPIDIPGSAVQLTGTPIRDCTSCSYTDTTIAPGATYCYWLELGSGAAYGPAAATTPPPDTSETSFAVTRNPAGDGTTFTVGGAEATGEIRIYDVSGRLVRVLSVPDTMATRDAATVVWDGTNAMGNAVPSGVYFAELRVYGCEPSAMRVRFVVLR
jgi:hypothetical protein